MKSDRVTNVYIPINFPACLSATKSIIKQIQEDQRFELYCQINGTDEKLLQDFECLGIKSKTFEQFVLSNGPKVLLSPLDYKSMWVADVKKLMIPSFGLQHGIEPLTPKYHTEELRPVYDVKLLWSQPLADVYREAYKLSPRSLKVVGNPNVVSVIKSSKVDCDEDSACLLLCDHRQLNDQKYFAIDDSILNRYVRNTCSIIGAKFHGKRCVIKPHPRNSDYVDLYTDHLKSYGINVLVDEKSELHNLIRNSQMCFVVHSSVYADCVLLGKPTVCFFLPHRNAPDERAFCDSSDLVMLVNMESSAEDEVLKGIEELQSPARKACNNQLFLYETWGSVADPVSLILDILHSGARDSIWTKPAWYLLRIYNGLKRRISVR